MVDHWISQRYYHLTGMLSYVCPITAGNAAKQHVFTSFSGAYKLLTKMGHVLGCEPIILKSVISYKLYS